jgi:hypothetical protein
MSYRSNSYSIGFSLSGMFPLTILELCPVLSFGRYQPSNQYSGYSFLGRVEESCKAVFLIGLPLFGGVLTTGQMS